MKCPRIPLNAALLAAFTLCFLAGATACAADAPRLVGGPCDYAVYPGKAMFLDVAPAPPGNGATPYPPYAATYRFTPNEPLALQGIHEEGKVQTLAMANGALPGRAFLDKYGVGPGKVFACELLVIRKGTCTPVIYRFPGIDPADYFEWGK